MTIERHKLIATYTGGAACDCGYDPRVVLEKDFDWTDAAREVLAHIKKSRRWKYQGTEVHHGFTYHLWQNELTGRKYAWEAETYRAQLTASWGWVA